jgi:cytochrome P450
VLDRLADIDEADLAADFAHVLPFWSISRKLGLPRGSEERQRAWTLAMLSYPADPGGALRASAAVTDFLRPTLAERRAAPADDVISGLLGGAYHGVRMSDEEGASHVRLLYADGATTTSDALSTLLWRVVTEPELLARARVEPEVLPRIVHESLRLEPAVCVLPRIAPDGGEVGGVELPPSSLVLCAIASANRDADVYTDPDRFDPDRAEGEILTFGFGAKYCPGSHLARQQLAAALEVVVHRLPDLARSTWVCRTTRCCVGSTDSGWRGADDRQAAGPLRATRSSRKPAGSASVGSVVSMKSRRTSANRSGSSTWG